MLCIALAPPAPSISTHGTFIILALYIVSTSSIYCINFSYLDFLRVL